MTRPVFLGEDLRPDPASVRVGDRVTLAGAEGRHAASVRRIGAGEWVDVVDGAGLRLTCEVAGADKSSLSLVVREVLQEERPVPEMVLVQALAKGGIDRVIPWASQRAIVQWKGPKADKGRAKWEGVARAAAKQSRRAFVPTVEGVMDSRELTSWVASLTDEAGVAFVCHEEASESLGAALASLQEAGADASLPPRVALIVGPEGGIGPEETGALVDAGARMIGLGSNVLRSSTAGAVALTLIRAAAGAY